MRAAVVHAFGEPLVIETVPDPSPPADGVVVAVRATGVCRSDWHGWMGHDPAISLPHVPGHELAGVVAAAGPQVRAFAVGDRVTVPFCLGCGRCEPCRAGQTQVCDEDFQPGFTAWGSFAELVALDWADVNLVALPEAVGFDAAAGLGCRFATAYRAVVQVGRLQPGEWLAVHGCGGVGLSAVMIAAAAGARVVAIDVSADALAAARAAGAELTARAGADVRELTSGGAHVSLDAIGSEAACAASVAGLRKRGRHVQVGLLPEPPRVPMDLVIARELELLGSHGMAARTYPELLALVEAATLRPGDLITREIGLDETPAALAAMGEGGPAGVTVIRP